MKSFDLNLPKWGPYNKVYLGVSNITDKKRGIGFNFNLFPGFYRRSVILPKDICDSGTKILKSSADLSHFLYRYELMWKDQVYIDADYKTDENGVVTVECKIVNNTMDNQSITLNGCASLKFPTFLRKNLDVCEIEGDSLWIDSLSYSDIKTKDIIAQEGFILGEQRVPSFTGGSGLWGKFFSSDGYASYDFEKTEFDRIYIRYKAEEDFNITLEVNGKKYNKKFKKSDEATFGVIETDKLCASSLKLLLKKGNYYIDGFITGENNLEFTNYSEDCVPEITYGDKKIILKYTSGEYEIAWDYDNYVLRELIGADAGNILTDVIHNHVLNKFYGEGKGHYFDIFIRPVFLEAESEKTVTFTIKRLDGNNKEKVNGEFTGIKVNSDGEKYKLSQDIMTANTLTNVVYPTYIRGEYIRHNTPGRLWDCLYTWDAGFIGMGLNAINKERAIDCLSNYMTELGDKHSPFIFRGSCVPTQVFLYQEIWNNCNDMEFLQKFYPHMRQYYEFFSRIIDEKTGISKTWEMFYNSGGWDDYPPQKYVHDNDMASYTYPVITASITILFAKIMKMAAVKLGLEYDLYDRDIIRISQAIQKNCWDEESGYFGYITLKDDKINLLKYNDEINYNMGFDGIYPYIAGITTDKQNERIFENIKGGLMTKYGVSVVDTRAPYFSDEGYWNGSVWMPHQWVLWKALFDRGEYAFAKKIAKTALEVWKNEVDLTYNCYEHFMIKNGRGAGFHQFSGLSTPVLMWYRAYYSPGTVTTGFYTFVSGSKWNEDYSSFECEISDTLSESFIMVCLNEKYDYDFIINEKPCEIEKMTNGAYVIKAEKGNLKIIKNNYIK